MCASPCVITHALLPQAIQVVKEEDVGDLQRGFASRYSFLELQDTNRHDLIKHECKESFHEE